MPAARIAAAAPQAADVPASTGTEGPEAASGARQRAEVASGAPLGETAPRRGGVVPDRGSVELRVGYDKPAAKVRGTVRGRIDDVAGRIRNANAATVRRGPVGRIEVWWPENHAGSTQRGYRIVDAAGGTVCELDGTLYTARTRPHELHYTLVAGSYRLDFWTDDGLRGELPFVVPESLEPGPLRLDLK